ncbi:MAG TPA: cytochrome c oxidase assembly protein [Tepidisphaeraceae bacterium]|nr:cytochrome c oxidase assembly protein [Tepidisphaeraceae bacterium]
MCELMMTPLMQILAHGDAPDDFAELMRAWSFEPLVVIGLVLSAVLYAVGLYRLWRAGGIGRGIRVWEAACYWLGWLALVVALVSPLHPWGRVLFSAHMTQHEILMLMAAPLIVLGHPLVVYLWAFPAGVAKKISNWTTTTTWQMIWRSISGGFAAFLISGITLWLWHAPALFQATLDNEWVHAAQHTSFLITALLFWWAVMRGRQHAANYGLAVLYMFATALHSGLLGALLTFARTVWYPAYSGTTQEWGLTPLEDQQLGGLIMWIPAGLVYLVAGLALMAAWLRESERRSAGQGFESLLVRGQQL